MKKTFTPQRKVFTRSMHTFVLDQERLNSPRAPIPYVPLQGPSSGLSTSLGKVEVSLCFLITWSTGPRRRPGDRKSHTATEPGRCPGKRREGREAPHSRALVTSKAAQTGRLVRRFRRARWANCLVLRLPGPKIMNPCCPPDLSIPIQHPFGATSCSIYWI